MIKIENDFLVVKAKSEGAELISIFNKKTNLEYLWQTGKEWPKHAPVLFPIVGQLIGNKYLYNDQSFSLDRHGFARSQKFEVRRRQSNFMEFFLKSSDETLKVFPFHFELKIIYSIDKNKLSVKYEVKNSGIEKMLFSIGGHPAFKVPLKEDENYEDYFLEFNQNEFAERWKLQNGLIPGEKEIVLINTNKLPLKKSLFYSDALVFKHLKSDAISIKSKKSNEGLHFHFKGFPYFGIWSAKDADFVCLEPWHGIADSVNHNQQLEKKEGIINLEEQKSFSCEYSIETF
jgi:galactose mutarotase-like enzyme